MDAQSLINTIVQNGVVDKISQSTNASKSDVEKIIAVGLPIIVKQMARNVDNETGVEKLDAAVAKDHAGGELLHNLDALFGGSTSSLDGAKILGHVFADRQSKAADTIAKKTGVETATVSLVLSFVAPLVMAQLGQKKINNNLDANGLGTLVKNMATSLFDKNNNGSVLDDIVGGFFGKKA